MRRLMSLIALAALAPLPALAQATTVSTPALPVTGNVPALCFLGTPGGTGSFPLGVLINTATGRLAPALTAPPVTITGSFCNAPSEIAIAATPLAAQNVPSAPDGFTRTVNYTATASGWTATPASFATGLASNASATQGQTLPAASVLSIDVSAFNTPGNDPFLVADTAYAGAVTVTLRVQ